MIGRLRLFFSFWAYPTLAAALLWAGLGAEAEGSVLDYIWLLPSGVFVWTLVEYVLHRFVFHIRSPRWRGFAYRLHGVHHTHPRDPEKILTSPEVSLPPSAVIFGAVWLGTGSLEAAAGVIAGVWTGFLYYEWVHLRVHTTHAAGILDRHRRWHFHHHFVDDRVCFGVTSPLWDAVFGTLKRASRS